MLAGTMRYSATVLRRSVAAGNPGGNPRGGFAVAFTTRAALKQANGFKRADAGLVEDQTAAVLRVYDNAQSRTITIADRIRLSGPGFADREFSIEAVSLPDAARRHIEIQIVQKIGG